MALDLQLQRTTGTIYGEIMRDSGISLPDGRYIHGNDFVSGLIRHGAGNKAARKQMLREICDTPFYGKDDNIWTGVQYINKRGISASNYFVSTATYTFSPWRELMNGASLLVPASLDRNRVFENLRRNPRKGVEKIREMYVLFARLPKSLQDDFLNYVDASPCDLSMMFYESLYHISFHQLSIIYKILKLTPQEHREDIIYVLELIAQHNICFGKGEIVRGQIEHFLGYDIKTIPTRWKQGHLDEVVITEKRAELEELLNRKK